jgi:halimadienyl-diphosphate synthase
MKTLQQRISPMNPKIEQLLNETGKSVMASLAYDTAWVARLTDIDHELGNHAMEWLSMNQLDDGSWGAKEPFYYHDRVISTLAAMIALAKYGRRATDKRAIQSGLYALERITDGATKGLTENPIGTTVGFEMIVPTLLAEAQKLGIIKQHGEILLGKLSKMRAAKLERLNGRLINKYITAAFSSEMVGTDGLNKLDLNNLQESNGSIGHSPAATAFYLIEVNREDSKSLSYLRESMATDGGFCDLYQFESFERAYVLWNLLLHEDWDDATRELMRPHLDYLHKAWKPGRGISYSDLSCVPIDADDTIYAYDMLKQHSYDVDIDAVLSLEEDDHFRCYELEAGLSPSVNIHAMHMLLKHDYSPSHPTIQKLVRYLDSVKVNNAYWTDKWHASPYYSTTHYIIGCAGYQDDLAAPSIRWLLDNQKPNGSWGFFMSTAEETAECLQALCVLEKKTGVRYNDEIEKGRKWLEKHSEGPYPPLWIGKGLYCPQLIVRSTVLSALKMANSR